MDKNVAVSCYSACIAQILCQNGVKITEREMFKNRYLLELDYDMPNKGICSNLELIINNFLIYNNIKIMDINIKDMQELSEKFLIYGGLILNLNCTELTYANVFKNAITMQNRHYVYIKDIFKNKVRILDLYIPEIVESSFEGWIDLDFEKNDYHFKQIDFSAYKRWDIKEQELICLMIHQYHNSLEKGVFRKCKKNIIEIQKREKPKDILYEMATSLSISGTINSRKIFFEIIKDNNNISEKVKSEVEKISLKYITLRLLLLKTYIKSEAADFMSLYKALEELEKKETEVYELIFNMLH